MGEAGAESEKDDVGRRRRVVILGGGPAGLGAAWALADEDVDTVNTVGDAVRLIVAKLD